MKEIDDEDPLRWATRTSASIAGATAWTRRSDHRTESADRIIGSPIDFLVGTARPPRTTGAPAGWTDSVSALPGDV